MRKLMIATALCLTAGAALAEEPTQVFNGKHIQEIVNAARTNEVRFQRDYQGKPFAASGPLRRVAANPFLRGTFKVEFGDGRRDVFCWVDDAETLNQIVDWRPGQRAEVRGTIKDTSFGSLQLEDCSFKAVSATAKTAGR